MLVALFCSQVEQKFAIENGVVERLAKVLDFKGEITMKDLYYDVPDCTLTCSDHWLRVRDGAWELKQVCVKIILNAVDVLMTYIISCFCSL